MADTTPLRRRPARPAELAAIVADLLAGAPPDWRGQALCAQTDPDLWYPEQGMSCAAAQRICRRCPVRDDCLEHALEHEDDLGVWGGLSGQQRARLKAQRAA